MFFGLDMEKLLLIGVFAAVILGPERLPGLARSLARLVARARGWTNDAKAKIKEEMGDDFDDVEWRKLDPRQYDPRRIVRAALLEEAEPRSPASAVAPVKPTPAAAVPASDPTIALDREEPTGSVGSAS